jgi:hypothetical protein
MRPLPGVIATRAIAVFRFPVALTLVRAMLQAPPIR